MNIKVKSQTAVDDGKFFCFCFFVCFFPNEPELHDGNVINWGFYCADAHLINMHYSEYGCWRFGETQRKKNSSSQGHFQSRDKVNWVKLHTSCNLSGCLHARSFFFFISHFVSVSVWENKTERSDNLQPCQTLCAGLQCTHKFTAVSLTTKTRLNECGLCNTLHRTSLNGRKLCGCFKCQRSSASFRRGKIYVVQSHAITQQNPAC